MTLDEAARRRIRELAEFATHGTWGAKAYRVFAAGPDGEPARGGMTVGMHPHIGNISRPSDADWIAAACPATVLQLLDDLDIAIALSETMRVELQRAIDAGEIRFEVDLKNAHHAQLTAERDVAADRAEAAERRLAGYRAAASMTDGGPWRCPVCDVPCCNERDEEETK